MLKGKCVVVGVTGSIAAYKAAVLVSGLMKLHAQVEVIMTENATKFIHPITFETLTGKKCMVDTFDRNFQFEVEHISLAKKADLFILAPATANVIGKIANGIADDMLTTTFMAATCPKIIAPAMNTNMYQNPIVVENRKKLASYGMTVLEAASGLLACKDVGVGKMPEPEVILEYVLQELQYEKDLTDTCVVVTAGPTREAIDPVRFISNHSTGKMGYAIAACAKKRGANVILISGPVELQAPLGVKCVSVTSAGEMYEQVMHYQKEADFIIKAAAVADFTPETVATEKIKKEAKEATTQITLKRTKDILLQLGKEKKPNQVICGFAMETEHLLENATRKLEKKQVDMIVANSLVTQGAGFGTDTNVVTMITKEKQQSLPLMGKEEVAAIILDEMKQLQQNVIH